MESNKNKDIVTEHFELQAKRDEILKRPMNSLTEWELDSLGKSELEIRLEKGYEGFTFSQFINHCAKE